MDSLRKDVYRLAKDATLKGVWPVSCDLEKDGS